MFGFSVREMLTKAIHLQLHPPSWDRLDVYAEFKLFLAWIGMFFKKNVHVLHVIAHFVMLYSTVNYISVSLFTSLFLPYPYDDLSLCFSLPYSYGFFLGSSLPFQYFSLSSLSFWSLFLFPASFYLFIPYMSLWSFTGLTFMSLWSLSLSFWFFFLFLPSMFVWSFSGFLTYMSL